MTKIYIFKKNSLYCGFEMIGHALFSNKEDILCSALSFLSINTCNSIEKVCSLSTEKDMNLEISDGSLSILIDLDKLTDEQVHDFQVIMKSFEVGSISLKKEYNKYIEIYYKEV